MVKILQEFKEDFEKVRKAGFIESHRSHNTGIGKTFEDLVNVVENNKQEVDYLDELELKSSRELSQSMVTLFTKAPSHPPQANTILRFKLDINDKEEKIYILIKDLKSDTIIDFECYYTFKDLKEIIEKKCKNIAFVTAKIKKENVKEFFHFEKAILLTGLTFDRFLKAIKDGDIFYDIRIGAYRSGKNKGKTHDHGSGFRIRKNKIRQVFKVSEI